eukprot:CAMPEP_0172314336 /NCGR_PEP_ID=MMETSP1058-20130122/22266_1 /TAXON_ID=83371 /ORGANISM="Detonula confervacea, Strain CCMP 353" /LENGTH=163 /DNA_ID=CAMNT_0013028167 /DNA_START=55 /DNA_END=546 /DNA_ORIENTATION=+
MAKGIRSKCKRANRTEFRNTHGTVAHQANMTIVQAKLQECINSGGMNSFDRLSKLFGNNSTTDGADQDGDVAMSTSATTKDSSKIPAKKQGANKHPRTGMYGDKTSRKMTEAKMKKARTSAGTHGGGNGGAKISMGRKLTRDGRSRGLRSSSKKRSGKKLATI